jgi:hypothetical protein
MESRQPLPINGGLNQQYRREAAIRRSLNVRCLMSPAKVAAPAIIAFLPVFLGLGTVFR